MAEYRTVKMSFWTDPYIEDLSAEGKLLYIYLFTCPYANNLGVMEVSIKRISYETGIKDGACRSLLADMERARKILRDGNLIWLTRFIKNQCSTSPKLVQSMKALFAEVASPKIRHAICLQYPHIFECSEDDMRQGNTLLPPDPYGTDTLSIPSGEMEYGIKNIEKEDINAQAPAKEPYSVEFEKFWSSYPRKKDKDAAWRAWKNKKKEKRLPPVDELIAIVEKWRETDGWQEEGGRYIPYPAKWLNAAAWLDELPEQEFIPHIQASLEDVEKWGTDEDEGR